MAQPPPPNCGRRLLINIVDQRALSNHQRPFACIPTPSGYRDVSYYELANAVNRAAAWLGQISSPGETLVFMCASDFRYQIFMLAAVKNDNVIFVPSPRSSTHDLKYLVRQAGATKVLTTLARVAGTQTIEIPSLEDLIDPKPVPWIRYTKDFQEMRFKPFIQIHSSGSTGTPKLITLKHGTLCAIDAFQTIGNNELHDRLGNLRMACSFPLFHMAGILYGLLLPIIMDSTVILPPLGPMNASVADMMHEQGRAQFSTLPPSLVVDLSKDPAFMKNIAKLKVIGFGGGPLPESVGLKIAEVTQLTAGWGASEYGACAQLRKDAEDWPFFKFNETESGLEFQEREGGLYEMVHVRKPHLDLLQPVFVTYPELNEFRTKDLFSPHPTKPGLWKYVCRADDVIVFSNGEKINPMSMEGSITSVPGIKGCVIIGQGRFQAICLLEPQDPDADQTALLEQVWPHIQEANKKMAQHGRIFKQAIFFTDPQRPLPRVAKGSVQRSKANQMYAEEINDMYQNLETGQSRNAGISRISAGSLAALESSIAVFLSKETSMGDVDPTGDFFAQGMDSLQLISLVRAINDARPGNPIANRHVYEHPSVKALSRFVWTMPAPFDANGAQGYPGVKHHDAGSLSDRDSYDLNDGDEASAWVAMDNLYNDFTKELNSGDKQKPDGDKKKSHGGLKSENKGPSEPPDGGLTAWLQVLASFLINLNNWGLVNTFGAFQAYYASDLLASSSLSDISWIGTAQGALLLIVGVVSGPLFDMGYFQALTVISSLGLVFALMMLSLATEYYQVFLCQGLLIGVCSGLLYTPAVAVLPVYFKRHRGLALGLGTGGGSVGGILYPIIFERLLQEVGFPWATRVIGFIALVTLGIAVIIIKPLGAKQRRQLIDRTGFKDVRYVAYLITSFLLFAGMLVPFFLAPIFASTPSIDTADAANYSLVFLNLGQLFGRLGPAISADFAHRFAGPELLLFCSQMLAGVLGFAWIGVTSLGSFIVWSLIYGFITGMGTTLPPLVMPYICPNMAVYGTRLGMLYAAAGVGFLISTPIATALDNATGGFLGAQVWTGSCCVAAGFAFMIVGWEARKRRLQK